MYSVFKYSLRKTSAGTVSKFDIGGIGLVDTDKQTRTEDRATEEPVIKPSQLGECSLLFACLFICLFTCDHFYDITRLLVQFTLL